jgi:hypothetical protein
MKLKQIAILLSGAALSATVFGANAANIGDETDTSWQYAPKAKPFFSANDNGATKQAAHIGDETDTSWQYTPKAKPFFADSNTAPKQSVRFGDENDSSWLYTARKA